MLGREKNIIVAGVDIGTSSIKTVAIERVGEVLTLKNYNELYLGRYVGKNPGEFVNLSYSQLGSALTDSIAELKVVPDRVVLGLPMSQCIFKKISIPVYVVNSIKDQNTLNNIISLEFKRVVQNVEILNYKISATKILENEKEIFFLVMAVKEEYIKMIQEVMFKMNISYSIEPNIFGAIKLLPINDAKESVALINIGTNNINLVFINGGKLFGAENIEVGINKVIFNVKNSLLSSYEEARNIVMQFDYESNSNNVSDIIKLSTKNIINEMINIFNNYEMSYNVRYSKVFIGGSSASIKNTKMFYQRELGKEVEVMNPFERVFVPAAVQNILEQNSSIFMNSLGLAISNI